MAFEVVKLISYFIYSLLDIYLLLYIGNKSILNIQERKTKMLLAILITFIVTTTINTLGLTFIKIFIIYLTLFLLALFLYKDKILSCFFRATLVIMIFGLADTVASTIMKYVINFDMHNLSTNLIYYIFYDILNYMFILFTVGLFKLKDFPSIINNITTRKTKVLFVSIMILQFLRIIVEFFIAYYLSFKPDSQYISFISFICSFSSILLLLYAISMIIDKDKIIQIKQEYSEQLEVYNQVLQSSIETQRKNSHEHGNNLTVLSGYLANNDFEKAKIYIRKIIGEISTIDNTDLNNIKESGLKALVVFKVAVIEKKGIDMEIVVDEEINDTIIPSKDLCDIIGVFLDNAIDATVESEDPYISLCIMKNNGKILISITNSIKKNMQIDKQKIFSKGYSTKGDGRGYGLSIVDDIIKKYEELELTTTVENEFFTQELCITNKIISSTKFQEA